ncbi:hypothetical protein [Comamonas koreensis]|uniref:hypothetical protein n=1 Tax=Comamonas koreensis TaxID=160825 RepID=UPI0015FB6312|nr:hypothetical protein [Comamonas koreensis]
MSAQRNGAGTVDGRASARPFFSQAMPSFKFGLSFGEAMAITPPSFFQKSAILPDTLKLPATIAASALRRGGRVVECT